MPGTGRLPITHQLHICEFASVSVPQPSNADGWPQVWRDENGYEFAQGYTISGVNYLSFPGIVVFTFSDNDERVVAIPESRTLSVLIEDLFWRSALPLILHIPSRDIQASAHDQRFPSTYVHRILVILQHTANY